ncbi:PREDICTED: uncharacterized protein LOC109220010 [Nicotiana attenuata]|uniref:uncharacterized protein LOC109220010 n=1 Tax=Nicotiana attenuata TaxID=49451 RepID=UPI00090517D1|nr:PREDICTED: uncharacterized protein LOC109220010 [Nicotiana attenuata]
MTWLIWNIRGVNKVYKQKELRKYIRIKNIKLLGLLETRVKQHRWSKITSNIAPNWGIVNDYSAAANGRIWVMWDQGEYSINTLKVEAQLIHCEVRDTSNKVQCVLTIVYGFNTVEERRSLWSSLQDISINTNCPWLVCGDFNAILTTADRRSCHPVTFNEVKEFADCINYTLLNELQWKGEYYTWTNKQQAGERVSSKIDRAFGNHDWMVNWGHIVLEYDLPNISDHAPMLLTLQTVSQKIRVPFRFFNIWGEHAQFLEIVEAHWKKQLDNDPTQNVWNKLKAMRSAFRQLNQKEFQATTEKIDRASEELQKIQVAMGANYDDTLVPKEKEALMQLEKWSMVEESILKQKSRAQWIQLGDSNSKYFAAVMKERCHRKQIRNLKSLQGGQLLSEPNDLKEELCPFIKD